ncbi:MAG: hypothetical protein M3Y37_05245 [Chloroflexota bacterium]|nr:hypothetical protein [Chloroflexota bacterium]
MHVANYLGLVHQSEVELADAYREVAAHHGDEPDIFVMCHKLAAQCDRHSAMLAPFVARYGEEGSDEPDQLHSELFGGTRTGGLGLLRDLHDLFLMATEVDISWIVIGQAAQGLRDKDLLATVAACDRETGVQLKWIKSRMKQAAPQTLIVA